MQKPKSPADQAEALAANGRVPEALLLLNRLAAANDKDALFKLGHWRLEGRRLPRDLAMARDFFGRAGAAGHREAAVIAVNFTANGTGGPSDWPKAIDQLRRLARSDKHAERQLQLVEKMSLTPKGDPVTVPGGEVLSQAPSVMLFPSAFTPEECTYLAQVAEPKFVPSFIVDSSGRQVQHPVRTSDLSGFPWPLENPAIHALNRRLAALSGTSVDQGEPLQVLRYRAGQEYKPHVDAVPGYDNQRFLTVLVYLNDNYKGGETKFLKTGLTVKGKRGDALLFRNTKADGSTDEMAMHAGLPVKGGVKLLASRWIRERKFEAPAPAAA